MHYECTIQIITPHVSVLFAGGTAMLRRVAARVRFSHYFRGVGKSSLGSFFRYSSRD